MKIFIKYTLRRWHLFLSFILVIFLFSFLLISFTNKQTAYYQATFTVEEGIIDEDKITDIAYLSSIKDSADKYSAIDIKKIEKNNGFRLSKADSYYCIQTEYKYYEEFYLKSILNVSTRAKTFISDVVNKSGDGIKVSFTDKNVVTLYGYTSPWLPSLYVTLGSSLLGFILFCLYYKLDENKEISIEKVEKRNFFKEMFKPIKKVKDMTFIAMLFALMMACKFIPIPSGFANLGLSFTYLFFSIACMIYGPVYGFVIGAFSDIIGFFINSGGGFFNLGYTLQAALTGVIYGLCFYKTKFSFSKTLLARFLVNMLMNVVLGSILWIIVAYLPNEENMTLHRFYELASSYALYYSLPKNVLYLLPQTLLLYVVLKAAIPILKHYKFIREN